MEYIDLRKVSTEEVKQIWLKKMGIRGKEIEEIVGVRQNRISEICSAYQRDGEAPLVRKKTRRKEGSGMILLPEKQTKIRGIIVETRPEEHGIPRQLWTLKKGCELVHKEYKKKVSVGCASDYMGRWGLSCQRPVKRARKQDPKSVSKSGKKRNTLR